MLKYLFLLFVSLSLIIFSVSGEEKKDIDYYIQNKKFPRVKKRRLKTQIISKTRLPGSKIARNFIKTQLNDSFLFLLGYDPENKLYLEFFSSSDFQLAYRELLTFEKFSFPVSGIFHANKFYTDYSIKYPDSKTYYDLTTFEEHKILNAPEDLKFFASVDNINIIAYTLKGGIGLLDSELNTIKHISKEELQLACKDTGNINHVLLLNDNNLFFSLTHGVGVLDITTFKVKNYIKENKGIGFPSVFKLNNKVYIEMLTKGDNLPTTVYRYNNSSNTFTKMGNDIRYLFFGMEYNCNIDDLTFLSSIDPGKDLAIIKGDFEQMVYVQFKQFKDFGYIKEIIKYKDTYLMFAGDGTYEFYIDDFYDLLNRYGQLEEGQDKIVRNMIVIK